MNKESVLWVYNASAGSGKTFLLVKKYLLLLLQSNNPLKFSKLLAITFTNKAAQEMKKRILDSLFEFSQEFPEKLLKNPLFIQLCDELQEPPKTVSQKSTFILENILSNYGAFDILTIDTFTHRLLRAFAKDLSLSNSFEVTLEVDSMLHQAVDALLEKTGNDQAITEVLVDFSLQKISQDKSWDVSYDLNKIAKLLVSENDFLFIDQLKSKHLSQFQNLVQQLRGHLISLKAKIKEASNQLLAILQEKGLERSHFFRNAFYDHLLALIEKPENISLEAKWKQNFEETSLYTKSQDQWVKNEIDGLRNDLNTFYKKTFEWVCELKLHKSLLKNLTSLSVLHLIKKELIKLQEEQNIVLISDFNKHIYTYLREQPAAFIYERLGVKYSNYFIDEFQDTSFQQWENLIPLAENSIASLSQDHTANSLFLVGDAKQAIYRWRGGSVNQFIDLHNGKSPFIGIPIQQNDLESNYRSSKEIVSFNNDFFKHISAHLGNTSYANNYKNKSYQICQQTHHGGVSIEFITAPDKSTLEDTYSPKTFALIDNHLQRGGLANDICILVRKNDQGALLSEYLSAQGLQVTSADSLLVKNSPIIQALMAILNLCLTPDSQEHKYAFLKYMCDVAEEKDKAAFMLNWIDKSFSKICDDLEKFKIHFSIQKFEELSPYEGISYLVNTVFKPHYSDAYVLTFLNVVHEFSVGNSTGLSGFIEHWEQKNNKLSVDVPAQKSAVQIMTIHKAKGLEFPIVIFPFANTSLYDSRNEYHWYPLKNSFGQDFDFLMLSHNKDLPFYGQEAASLYQHKRQEQEFDAFNMLYVALTRASQQMHVITELPNKEVAQPTNFSGLFVSYLKSKGVWSTNNPLYTFGKFDEFIEQNDKTKEIESINSPDNIKDSLNLNVAVPQNLESDLDRQEAIDYGNLIHELLAGVQTKADVDFVIDEAIVTGKISELDKETYTTILNKVTNHIKLKSFFKQGNIVQNEQPILSPDGTIIIPDRVEITQDNSVLILDYKTGQESSAHKHQLKQYTAVLENMNFTIKDNYLVYIDKNNTVNVV